MCTVLASEGYPDRATIGDQIKMPDMPPGAIAFHAGTRRSASGALETAAGRVLNIVGTGGSMREARDLSILGCDAVLFRGKQLRRDIGWREMDRAGTT